MATMKKPVKKKSTAKKTVTKRTTVKPVSKQFMLEELEILDYRYRPTGVGHYRSGTINEMRKMQCNQIRYDFGHGIAIYSANGLTQKRKLGSVLISDEDGRFVWVTGKIGHVINSDGSLGEKVTKW